MNNSTASQSNSPNSDSIIMNLIADNEMPIFNIIMLVSLSGNQYIDLKPILRRLVVNEIEVFISSSSLKFILNSNTEFEQYKKLR